MPKHRKNTPNICIEHYYLDSDLKRTLNINGVARRIYMGNEFYTDALHCHYAGADLYIY